MAKYASGKHAYIICDRCGQRERYLDARKEWNGLKVCRECYEPRHPRDIRERRDYNDPKPLHEPRPEETSPTYDAADNLSNYKPSTSGQGTQDQDV